MISIRRQAGLLCIALAAIGTSPLSRAAPEVNWPEIGSQQKPWTRWWWPGSAVDEKNITRELSDFASAGFGGVEITPIYGAKGAESRFIPFLSDRYMDVLKHTSREAARLGMGVDMATGTGWPFGGPSVSPEFAEQKLEFSNGQIAPGQTGFKVKRSAPGGQGLVVNPFSTEAATHYLQPFTEAFKKVPAKTIRMQFHDSYEYTATWANDVLAKFQAMHGYDLGSHVAELTGLGDVDTVARIKSDYRETLGNLHMAYVKTWIDWTHSQGSQAREQAHGAGANLLDLYAAADVAETETFGSTPFPIPGFRNESAEIGVNVPQPLVSRFASSASNTSGHLLVSSETFTWLREHFHEAPSEMKPEVDQMFLAGINHVFYHGSCYSPADVGFPGWVFYAATQFNSRNPLWADFAQLNHYIARCQSMLQSGKPDNDVLVYWPVYDHWHQSDGLLVQFGMHSNWLRGTAVGNTMETLVAKGYAFDLISDAQLATASSVDGGIRTQGALYRTLLVPKTGHLPVETMQAILRLVEEGATVIFGDSLPADVPGFGSLEARRKQLREDLHKLSFDAPASPTRTAKLGKGTAIVTPAWTDALDAIRVTREAMTDGGLKFNRRKIAGGYLYFIANQTADPIENWMTLSRPAGSAALMDARTGVIGAAALRNDRGVAAVYLQLKPGESIFLRTFDAPRALADSLKRLEGKGISRWQYTKPAGPETSIQGNWKLTFEKSETDRPAPAMLASLQSWTALGEPAAQSFAGTARYEIDFDLPSERADKWLLNLGDVRETARIFVNGKEVDWVWSIPFQAQLGKELHAGKNKLQIDVTNLAANRVRDLDLRKVQWKNFYEINFVNIHYLPFDASKWPLQPSGLLGPVTLIPLQTVMPK